MSETQLYPPEQYSTWRMECRKYEPSDSEVFYASLSRNRERLLDRFPELVEQIGSEEDKQASIDRKIIEWEKAESFSYAIWDKATGHYAGEISLLNFDWKIPKAEITCFLTKEFEGRGIMSEILKKTVKIAFEEIKLNKLCIRMRPHNNRSSQMALRAGFVKEGIIRNDFIKWNNTLCDLCYYGITSQDYFKAQQMMLRYTQPSA